MKISVIIATHGRPDSLAILLRSLMPQLVQSGHEILIADNGTPDPSLTPEDVPVACHIHDPSPGKCRVQNRAIARAAGEIIVCLDDDLAVASTYLDAVERFFGDYPGYAAMKGRVLLAEDPELRAGADYVYMDLPIVDHGDQVCEVRGVLGANMAFRAAALAKVGLFDERLGPGACGHEEDTEMSARLRAAGFKIGYCPQALVYHEVDPARADRARFIRIARQRGYCRMMHEHHTAAAVWTTVAVAGLRLGAARLFQLRSERLARETKRLAIGLGMLDALRHRRPAA